MTDTLQRAQNPAYRLTVFLNRTGRKFCAPFCLFNTIQNICINNRPTDKATAVATSPGIINE